MIPQNGPIALNYPLTLARRGSCNTETVHPYFLGGINQIIERVGILNPVYNPYELKMKGEMVDECLDQMRNGQSPCRGSHKTADSLCSSAGRLRAHHRASVAIGMHPLFASVGIRELVAFKRMALYANYIGEVGLDFSRYEK